ncbi:hydrolase, acting on ester bonds, putative [Ricinus communis]|uniref:Hydrolase, acting on ester bonds, putative n=2 Tax=Ricinus communis TaxID=3988 RepID=B9RM98_RICCO|nr:hydrolase, acting on ester bonds, putative [Ricinus communis]
MAPIIFLFLLATFLAHPFSLLAKHANHISSSISVVGVVYCDTCSTNSFSRHSYFLPGVDVQIQCTFKANAPKTAEQINISVNRTTDRYGTYKLEVPHVDGVDCVDGSAIESVCQASLISSSTPACNVLGSKTTTDQISIKSKQDNHCIYSLNALSYKPAKTNATLCGNHNEEELLSSFNSSKCFLPYFPPFPWPYPLPQFPPLPPLPFPPLPPYSSLPFPPLPPLPSFPFPPFPFPYSSPPSLPFPFPPLPPTPSFFQPPPPPAFNLGDPRTWIPHIPSLSLPPPPPPPPAFNLGDPRTWIPHIPSLSSPPPPPAFNLRDPRTWIPYLPPSPPNSPQNQNP